MFILLESLLLVISLTTDAFSAGLSYGASKIKIPKKSVFIISLFCSFMLFVSLILGSTFANFIPNSLTRYICFAILFSLGITRLFDLILKNYINRKNKIKLKFSLFSLKFILTVYADAKKADADNSKTLSPKEAFALALALSLDGIAVGFGAAIGIKSVIIPVVISLIFTFCAIKFGEKIGENFQEKIPFDLSYISSILLLCLAFLKL